MSSMLENLTNSSQKDQLEERMTRIKEDPSLKPILEEIESGGPAAMMRYWNDQDVLKNLGEAMGFSVAGEGAPLLKFLGQMKQKKQMKTNPSYTIVLVWAMWRA